MSITLPATRPATTPRRDPFLDLVRAGAILLVVLQHWLMPVLSFRDGQLATGNALTTPGWWVLTWVSQVMPMVFFAGGAANLISYRAHQRRGGTAREWLGRRLHRLVLPVLALIAVWVPLPHLLADLGVPAQPLDIAGGIAAQLLWFLVVYLGTVLLTPIATRAHDRFGLGVLAVLAVLVIGVDSLRWNGVPMIGFANAAFVWVAVHQLGFHYVDGVLTAASRLRGVCLMLAGFGTTALLVIAGPYPASMVGMPGAPASNMSPPSACLLAVACGQLGLLLWLRPRLLRLTAHRPFAAALNWLGARCMTVYLWHMPALITVAGIAVLGLGYATPEPGSLLWFAVAPAWLGVLGLTLAGLVRLFGRFEATGRPPRELPALPQLIVGALLVAGGLLGLVVTGFGPPAGPGAMVVLTSGPVPPVALVLLGFALLGHRFPVRRSLDAGADRGVRLPARLPHRG